MEEKAFYLALLENIKVGNLVGAYDFFWNTSFGAGREFSGFLNGLLSFVIALLRESLLRGSGDARFYGHFLRTIYDSLPLLEMVESRNRFGLLLFAGFVPERFIVPKGTLDPSKELGIGRVLSNEEVFDALTKKV